MIPKLNASKVFLNLPIRTQYFKNSTNQKLVIKKIYQSEHSISEIHQSRVSISYEMADSGLIVVLLVISLLLVTVFLPLISVQYEWCHVLFENNTVMILNLNNKPITHLHSFLFTKNLFRTQFFEFFTFATCFRRILCAQKIIAMIKCFWSWRIHLWAAKVTNQNIVLSHFSWSWPIRTQFSWNWPITAQYFRRWKEQTEKKVEQLHSRNWKPETELVNQRQQNSLIVAEKQTFIKEKSQTAVLYQ